MKRASESLLILLFLLGTTPISVAQNADYKTLTDIPYYREDIRQKDRYINERCRLDIYFPAKKKEFATIVWFHGGGLTGGNKELPEALKNEGILELLPISKMLRQR